MTYAPVPDPAAWKAADFASPDAYRVTLDTIQIAQLAAAIDGFRTSGRSYAETRRSDFPLPALAATLTAAYHAVKSGRGFVVLSGLPAERGAEWMRGAVWGLGTWFGDAVNQTVQGSMLTDVKDANRSASNTRYYNTPHALELHIDPASDLIALGCIRQAARGGGSALASALTVHNEMARSHPDRLEVLYRGFHLHRFAENRPEDGEITAERVPFFAERDGKVSWRGFEPAMIAGHRELGLPLTSLETAAIATFNEIAKRPENCLQLRLEPGDLLITNNLAILHGRGEFTDEGGAATPRHLLRLWLAGRDFRPIRPEMNYFNGGACGIPLVPGRENFYHAAAALKTAAL